MATTRTKLKQLVGGNAMDASTSGDRESQISDASGCRKRGGWITFPFIAGTLMGLSLAAGGWLNNLIVFLIQEFNIKSIDATQTYNIVNGCTNLFPIVGAIISDSFLSSFTVISTSSIINLLGILLITLSSSLDSLRPPPCDIGSSSCKTPTTHQYAVLYGGIALAVIGTGGTRFTLAAMGANQFDKPQQREVFFNWYFAALYLSSLTSATAIVYVQDSVSWRLGFWLCFASSFAGSVIFFLGSRFYLRDKPQGSPFRSLARVVVATIRKWKVMLSSRSEDYYQDSSNGKTNTAPKQSFRFLNRAALKTEGDIGPDGSIAKPWRICTVQQVEDLKTIIRILAVWTTSIFLCTPIVMQLSLSVLQALTMNRHMGPHFKIPAGSIIVMTLISSSIVLPIIDRFLYPIWKKVTHYSLTPLQRIGVGHVVNGMSMVVSALVERKRLEIAHSHHLQDQPGSIVPMYALWLFPQLVLAGIGEAFQFPGQVSLYYQEFPESLKSTSTAMIGVILGLSFYLSTALTHLIRRVTNWLPDNLNNGRLDNVYWTLLVISGVNFCYYLVCSWLYKYQNAEKEGDENGSSGKLSDNSSEKARGD